VTVRLADKAGAPIAGAQVTVEAFHNARASRILSAALDPRGQGYSAVMPLERPGLWEFRLRVTRGPEVFVATLTRDVTEGR
jgi:nitrogen fixation protein FixH